MSDEARDILSRSLVHQISQLQAERDAARTDLAAARAAISKAVEDLVEIELEEEVYAAQQVRADLATAPNDAAPKGDQK